jgi:hypothetical protein
MQIKKLAVAAGAVGALALSLVTAAPASADYGPSSSDVVGVGSDTVQFVIDYLADGTPYGTTGYNTGKRNKLISFDATPDANARLAYGSFGLGSSSPTSITGPAGTAAANYCAPGTGGTVATGNQNTSHLGDKPCVLNPTVVLRAGTRAVTRPNGSSAGFNALKADVANVAAGAARKIDFSRASSARGNNATYSSVVVGTDGLYMLSQLGGNAVALSNSQLAAIYKCDPTADQWTEVGGTSTATIKPLLPQVGSGTRKDFLATIVVTEAQVGSCVDSVEENDPEAIAGSGSEPNAIEPMSTGRLNMYLGKSGATGNASLGTGIFNDPSCTYDIIAAPCNTNKVSNINNTLSPNVKIWTVGTGTPTAGGAIFGIDRPLYVYFRAADLQGQVAFQPGTTRNWVRTLFYNPCSGFALGNVPIVGGVGGNCVDGDTTDQYGPGGTPALIDSFALVEAAGMNTTIGTGLGAFGAFDVDGA